MATTNGSHERVLHDLVTLDVDVKSYEIAFARKRARDEKRELLVGLLVVVLSTVVGTTIFASLSTSPATWIKVIAGTLSILAAVLAAINQWAPFTGGSQQQRRSEAACGDIRVDVEDVIRRLREHRLTVDEALTRETTLDRRYKKATENEEKSPSVSDSLYRESRDDAKKEVEADFGIRVDLTPR
jgi:hypothetical protein